VLLLRAPTRSVFYACVGNTPRPLSTSWLHVIWKERPRDLRGESFESVNQEPRFDAGAKWPE